MIQAVDAAFGFATIRGSLPRHARLFKPCPDEEGPCMPAAAVGAGSHAAARSMVWQLHRDCLTGGRLPPSMGDRKSVV